VAEGYINQPISTTVTVVPEAVLEEYVYTFTYSVLAGEGYFEDLEGKTYASEETIPFNPLSSSIMYKGTAKGEHTVHIVAQDNFGEKQDTQIKYTIIDVPVEWAATSPVTVIELGKRASVATSLGVSQDAVGVSYERNYSITTNQGEIGPAAIEFQLRDSNNQEKTETLNFEVITDVVDTNAPELKLLGENPLELFLGASFVDPGATAYDDIDEDITSRIAIDSTGIDNSKEGSYAVNYTVADDDGNTASVQRTRLFLSIILLMLVP